MDKTPHQLLRDGACATRHLATLSAEHCLIERDANRLMAKILAGLKAALRISPQSETVLDASAAGFRLAHYIGTGELDERTADPLLIAIQAGFQLLLPLGTPRPPEVTDALMDHLRSNGLMTGRRLAQLAQEAAGPATRHRPSTLDWSAPAPAGPDDLPETVARLQAVIDQGLNRMRTVGRLGVIDGGRA